MNDKVLISVLNYNNFPSKKKCILSLLKLDYSKFQIQILIIDNKSRDNSYEKLIEEFPTLKIFQSISNGGYAAGHKMSVNYAVENNFDFIWILNNDLTVREDTLLELLKSYKKYGLGLYGSITLKSETPDIVNFGGGKTDDISKPFDYNAYENISLENYNNKTNFRAVQSIEGSSFLIPITVIKEFGFMREDFFMYAEEVDYCYYLKNHSIKSYIVPKSRVIHEGGNSLKKNMYLEEYYRRRNFLLFMKKYYKQRVSSFILRKIGIKNFLIFLIKKMIRVRDENYYFNLATFHALIKRTGKL